MNCCFITFGCKVNTCETAGMELMVQQAGHTVVKDPAQADAVILNSCTVTESGDNRVRTAIRKIRQRDPQVYIVLTGCFAQAYPERAAQITEVDLVLGTKNRKRLPELLHQLAAKETIQTAVEAYTAKDAFEVLPSGIMPDNTRGFLKIQDGCNQFCSYCIIPYTRGRVRSRRPEDIEHEVRGIAEAGYKEIVLTGIHLSSYGVDFKDEQQENLLTLIKRLDQIPGIERLRLGSLEPRIVTREFAKELARLRTICPHFHLSLQSGCDATLKRMNRRYNAAEYQACCEILREEFDNPAITTDVIVGFPGETEEEFAETERFLKAIHFYEMHIFKYSRRAGTRAADMPDQVPEGTKSVRSDILLALEKQQSLEYRGRFLGTEEEILLEEPIEIDGTKYMMGHTRQYVKGAVPYEEGLKNKTVKGIFTKALNEEVLLLEKE